MSLLTAQLSVYTQILPSPTSGFTVSCWSYYLLVPQVCAKSQCCASFFVCRGLETKVGKDAFLRALSFQMGYRQQTMKPQMGDHARHKS